jgi:hypothetical protein
VPVHPFYPFPGEAEGAALEWSFPFWIHRPWLRLFSPRPLEAVMLDFRQALATELQPWPALATEPGGLA